jgi:uncharacterized protein YrzB (UPF0473 family)
VSSYTLGIDTSNYATSLAVFDTAGEVVCAKKRFLPVKEGQLGLRQSDALFHHTAALPEMLEEAAPDLLTLEDEDGKEVTFEVIDATEVNGTRYLAVIPYQEDPESLQEDAELILMRIGTDDEGEYMDIVDDDEELITVGKVFEERLRAMYDIDDSELQ